MYPSGWIHVGRVFTTNATSLLPPLTPIPLHLFSGGPTLWENPNIKCPPKVSCYADSKFFWLSIIFKNLTFIAEHFWFKISHTFMDGCRFTYLLHYNSPCPVVLGQGFPEFMTSLPVGDSQMNDYFRLSKVNDYPNSSSLTTLELCWVFSVQICTHPCRQLPPLGTCAN